MNSKQLKGNNMIEIPTGWNVVKNVKPIPVRTIDYDFWHDDHDGDPILNGHASSIEDAVKQIKFIELCHGLGEE